jgi:N-acylglucosamine-6-phosphate 2-epimerase
VPGYDVYITPRIAHAVALAVAGADVIAIDATARPHPEGETSAYIAAVRSATGLPLLADISTLAEAIAAAEAGADLVSTTMSGYTDETRNVTPALSLERRGSGAAGPDLELVRQAAAGLATRALMWDGRPCPSILSTPVIAEGRISTPEEARAALDAGAFAVVVGGAITRPQQITARFVRAITVSHKEF